MASRALVVIDMQKDLCRDLRRRDKVEIMLDPLVQAIDEFDRKGEHVFYVCFSLMPGDPQFERFGDEYCIRGTEGAEIIDELRPLRGPVIDKQKHSAFFETSLDEQLREVGVEELYLTGLQTHICIMTTAADASFRGYDVAAIRECVVSSSEENKVQALDWIEKYVGRVIAVEEVLGELRQA